MEEEVRKIHLAVKNKEWRIATVSKKEEEEKEMSTPKNGAFFSRRSIIAF